MNNDTYFIINNYLNILLEDDKDILDILKSLELFCVKNNYSLDDDIIEKLLENNRKLYDAVGNLVAKNITFIRNDTISKYISSVVVKLFIYAYCNIGDIDIDINAGNSIPYYGYAMPRFSSKDEEIATVIKAKKGDKDAKNELIMRNIKLVIYMAKKYVTNVIWLEDLVEEGIEGILIAIKKFDISNNTKFSSYAAMWIKQKIIRYVITKQHIFRALQENNYLFSDFKTAYEELTNTLQREPTFNEIADKLNTKIENIEVLMRVMAVPVSLDEPLNDYDDAKMVDAIIDSTISIEEKYELDQAQHDIDEILYSKNLADKEVMVIKMLF